VRGREVEVLVVSLAGAVARSSLAYARLRWSGE
jgi:hypothetical protein